MMLFFAESPGGAQSNNRFIEQRQDKTLDTQTNPPAGGSTLESKAHDKNSPLTIAQTVLLAVQFHKRCESLPKSAWKV